MSLRGDYFMNDKEKEKGITVKKFYELLEEHERDNEGIGDSFKKIYWSVDGYIQTAAYLVVVLCGFRFLGIL